MQRKTLIFLLAPLVLGFGVYITTLTGLSDELTSQPPDLDSEAERTTANQLSGSQSSAPSQPPASTLAKEALEAPELPGGFPWVSLPNDESSLRVNAVKLRKKKGLAILSISPAGGQEWFAVVDGGSLKPGGTSPKSTFLAYYKDQLFARGWQIGANGIPLEKYKIGTLTASGGAGERLGFIKRAGDYFRVIMIEYQIRSDHIFQVFISDPIPLSKVLTAVDST